MSLIGTIVAALNTYFSGTVFVDPKFDTKRIVGLAYPYPEKKGNDTLIKIVPAQYSNSGEGTRFDINDDFSLMIYHRLSTIAYQQVQTGKVKAVGDDYLQQMTADVTMTVWALRPSVQMQPDDLNDLIVNSFPTGLADLNGVKRCLLTPVQTDFDFIGIFRREYQSVDYFLKPEHILFQVKYRAVALVKNNCIN